MYRLSVIVSLVLLLGAPGPAPGAERHWLEGTWIVHFSTDQRPRLFEVTKVSRSFFGGGWKVEATYGYADGGRAPVEVTLEGRDDDIEVGFVTSGKTKIFVRRAADHRLTGSGVLANGRVATLTMRRASGDEVDKAKTALGASSGTTPFDAETQLAEVKAALGGVWSGPLGKGGQTRTLDVQSLVLTAGGGIEVRGTYAAEGGPVGNVKAIVSVEGSTMTVRFWTGVNSRVVLEETGPDQLSGTLTNPQGRELPLTLTRREARDIASPSLGIVLVAIYRPT